jgi:hypothetical protein
MQMYVHGNLGRQTTALISLLLSFVKTLTGKTITLEVRDGAGTSRAGNGA